MTDRTGVLLCRPVDVSDMPDDVPIPNVYPGSIEDKCAACGRAVWVGPQQQRQLHSDPELPIGCYLCLFAAMDAGFVPERVVQLSDVEVGTRYKDGRPGD